MSAEITTNLNPSDYREFETVSKNPSRIRKYRPQHWLIELVENGRRKRSVLLQGNRKNIDFYIRNNTEYLMPFYRAIFKMATSRDGECEVEGKMLTLFESLAPTGINVKDIEEILSQVPDEELLRFLIAKHRLAPGKETYVNISRLPQCWNTRPRHRPEKTALKPETTEKSLPSYS